MRVRVKRNFFMLKLDRQTYFLSMPEFEIVRSKPSCYQRHWKYTYDSSTTADWKFPQAHWILQLIELVRSHLDKKWKLDEIWRRRAKNILRLSIQWFRCNRQRNKGRLVSGRGDWRCQKTQFLSKCGQGLSANAHIKKII